MRYIPLKRLTGHNGSIYKLIDTSENHFYSLGGDCFIVSWQKNIDEDNGKLIAKTESSIYCGCLINDDNNLIVGCLDGSIVNIDLTNNSVIKNIKSHSNSIYDIITIDDKIISCGGDGTLIIYTYSLDIILKIQLSYQALRCLAFDKYNQQLFIGGSDKKIHVLDLNTLEVRHKFIAHDSSVFSLFINDNNLYSGGRDAKLIKWNLDTLQKIKTTDAHLNTVNDILLHHDIVVTASRDKNIRLWTNEETLIQTLSPVNNGHFNSVNTLINLSGTNYFASGSDDRSIIIWGLEE